MVNVCVPLEFDAQRRMKLDFDGWCSEWNEREDYEHMEHTQKCAAHTE